MRRYFAPIIVAIIAGPLLLAAKPGLATDCFVDNGSNVTSTCSTTHHETDIHVDLPTIYSTRVIGRLKIDNLGDAIVFDQTVALQPYAPQVTKLLSLATKAVKVAGGPAVIVTGPVLTTKTKTRQLGDTTAGINTTVTVSVSFGPGTILVGDDQTVSHFVPAGKSNINTNTAFETFVNKNFQETISSTWQVTGHATVHLIGTIHTAVQSAGFDLGSRFLGELGDKAAVGENDNGGGSDLALAAPSPVPAHRAWGEAYGLWSAQDADGMVPGNTRSSSGLAGGFGFRAAPGLDLGFGIDQGWTSIDENAASEHADVALTQFGLNAAVTRDRWVMDFAGIAGFGSVDTVRGSAALGGISTASYDLRLWGALAEIGYQIPLGAWTITPKIGLDWTNVRTDAFTESGGLAITADAYSANRTRGWLGVKVEREWQVAGRVLDFAAYARIIDVLSGRDRLLPVSFAGMTGAPLTISGLSEGRFAAELGAAIAVHLTPRASLFAAYDGSFGDGGTSNAATLGFNVSW